jgi:uncharacterized membrane protein YkvI
LTSILHSGDKLSKTSTGATVSKIATINRYLLPGLAFKAVVIGGGYATGRELVEFFLPSGPAGGLLGMGLAMLLWSAICVATFVFAYDHRTLEYKGFFQRLLGPCSWIFELIYLLFLMLILSVFGSAAGSIGNALFGWPELVGSLLLVGMILAVCVAGQGVAEKVFKYVSVLLYAVYALFLLQCLLAFGPQIDAGFAKPSVATSWFPSWISGGITYASYNAIGAVLILPVLRHLTSRRDAVVAGLIAGPLAMAPAIVFFICLAGFYPAILSEPLPSDYILQRLDRPAFHLLFQLMVMAALLESGVGFVQAFNVRIGQVYARRQKQIPLAVRILVPAVLTLGSVFVASKVGLIELIASGYRFIAWAIIGVFIVPLFTLGLFRVLSPSRPSTAA